MTQPVPRPEYPRPQFQRDRWACLNGPWPFAFDDDDRGMDERWFALDAAAVEAPGGPFDRRITVPFCYQAELSGINDRSRHDVVWYARGFDDVRADPGERLVLHFGAVDYRCKVWVNGRQVAEHEGGHTPFSADIAPALRVGEAGDDAARGNVIVMRVEDPLDDLAIPRGKQYWKTRSDGIWYTPTTGIWQTVWLEPVPAFRIEGVGCTPDLDNATVGVDLTVSHADPTATLRVRVVLHGVTLIDDRLAVTTASTHRRYSVIPPSEMFGARVAHSQGVATWSPSQPNLYDLHLELLDADGRVVDAVDSYFGMRKISVLGDEVHLNNRAFFQRLVLDQGYFPGGLLTAATDADLRRDIELAKELGFNGARKHQKVEDPRWLYWADRLGFLVWGEMPSAYQFTDQAVARVTAEWQAVVRRDYNHPCIVVWVPMNESWGVPQLRSDRRQRDYLLTMYHLTRSLDASRLVVGNDGWEHALSDLLTVHDYSDADRFRWRHRDPQATASSIPWGDPLYVPEHGWRGEPILITEFGGIAFEADATTWGYHEVRDDVSLLEGYREIVKAIASTEYIAGFCYTQLTDVEQEANGLLTFDRKPKHDPDAIRAVTQLPGHPGRRKTSGWMEAPWEHSTSARTQGTAAEQ